MWRGYDYHVCRTRTRPSPQSPGERCPTRCISGRPLEELAWRDLCEVLTAPETIVHAMGRARGGHWLPQEMQARRTDPRRARAGLQQQVERLTGAYLAGVVPLSEYQRRRREVEARLLAPDGQERELTHDAGRQAEVARLAAHAEAFCRRVRQGLDQADFHRERELLELLELLVDRVVVTGDAVEIRYAIPTGPEGEREPFCRSQTDHLVMTVTTLPDKDLLDVAAQNLGIGTEELLSRYYGSPGGARYEMEQLDRTGRLQEGFARTLRTELGLRRVRHGEDFARAQHDHVALNAPGDTPAAYFHPLAPGTGCPPSPGTTEEGHHVSLSPSGPLSRACSRAALGIEQAGGRTDANVVRCLATLERVRATGKDEKEDDPRQGDPLPRRGALGPAAPRRALPQPWQVMPRLATRRPTARLPPPRGPPPTRARPRAPPGAPPAGSRS